MKTIPDLIIFLLDLVQKEFYRDRAGEFRRDERALTKAIARYGYECEHRGWQFDIPQIRQDLFTLLKDIRSRKADFRYLPVYLDAAIRKHVGQRAEELSAKAKSVPHNLTKILRSTKRVEVVREPSPTEILSLIYRDLKKKRPSKPKTPEPPAEPQLFL